jgi:hypothetical protein
MTLGSTEAVADGESEALEAAPLLVGGKILIPLAFSAGKLGWSVSAQKEEGLVRYSLTPGS